MFNRDNRTLFKNFAAETHIYDLKEMEITVTSMQISLSKNHTKTSFMNEMSSYKLQMTLQKKTAS